MKLIRFDDNKTGLVVELLSGPHIIDVVASIAALVPGDPISPGVWTCGNAWRRATSTKVIARSSAWLVASSVPSGETSKWRGM